MSARERKRERDGKCVCVYVCVCRVSAASDEPVCMPTVHADSCLQVSFRKRATNYRAVLRMCVCVV